jgi:CheY-like chemotaxis protein
MLLDMDMPRMDGLGVLETLRKRLPGRYRLPTLRICKVGSRAVSYGKSARAGIAVKTTFIAA